jgi:transposase
MRYELTADEWIVISSMVPQTTALSSTTSLGVAVPAPWRDLPDSFGPYTACYDRASFAGYCSDRRDHADSDTCR